MRSSGVSERAQCVPPMNPAAARSVAGARSRSHAECFDALSVVSKRRPPVRQARVLRRRASRGAADQGTFRAGEMAGLLGVPARASEFLFLRRQNARADGETDAAGKRNKARGPAEKCVIGPFLLLRLLLQACPSLTPWHRKWVAGPLSSDAASPPAAPGSAAAFAGARSPRHGRRRRRQRDHGCVQAAGESQRRKARVYVYPRARPTYSSLFLFF